MYFLWVLLYEIIYMIAAQVSAYLSETSFWKEIVTILSSVRVGVSSTSKMDITYGGTVFALIAYLVMLYCWLKKTGRKQDVGLTKISMPQLRECIYGIPLLALPLFNYLTAQEPLSDISYAMLMVCVAVIEDIFFRGFLYDILSKWNKWGYILISAILFGAFHLVNFLEGYPVKYVLMQALCAFFAGICYAALTVKTKSILPAMIAHVLTNVSAGGTFEIWSLCFGIVIYMLYGIWLCKKIENKKGNDHEVLY